jgi:hypothetical protein
MSSFDFAKLGNSIKNGVSDFTSNLTGAVEDAANAVSDFVNVDGFAKDIRSKNLPDGSLAKLGGTATETVGFKKPVNRDWRVRLSIPNVASFKASPLLSPLKQTNGLVFPFTPTIIVAHSANYQAITPTHTNYPYFAYQNSQVDQLVITGDFFVQNGVEAEYWVAALHYLRSATKMFYGGEAETLGAPPPVVKLNGYGDFIFNNVPVVVTNFTVDLPQDVDYIATGLGKAMSTEKSVSGAAGQTIKEKRDSVSWAPTQSLITVTVQPIYSRREIEKFSLQNYVNGEYIKNGGGFI